MKWEMVRLDDVCEVSGGTTPSTQIPEYWNGNIPWLSPIDLPEVGTIVSSFTTGRQLTDAGIKRSGLQLLPVGTVAYSTRASIGKILVGDKPFTTNQGFTNFICGEHLHNRFLAFALKWYTPAITKLSNSTTFAEVSRGNFKTFKIPVPPLPIQQKIAAILDAADTLRQKDKALLGHYDALLQSTFHQMFGDPVKNEMGWEVKRLGDVSDIVSGIAKNASTITAACVDVPYMRVANVQDGHIDLREVKSIKVLPAQLIQYKLQYGDILLTEGGDPDKLGRGAVWHGEIDPCIHQNHIFRVRTIGYPIDPLYLSRHIGSEYGKRYFLKAAKQTTGIASINLTQLRNFPCHIPPLTLQVKYSDIAQNIQRQKAIVKEQATQSEALFQSLLHEAFNG